MTRIRGREFGQLKPINDDNKLVVESRRSRRRGRKKGYATFHVPDLGKLAEKSSGGSFRTIGTKERAEEIVTHFKEAGCTYARIKYDGLGKLTPELLNTVFTPCKFYWNNIFRQKGVNLEGQLFGMIVLTPESKAIILRYIARGCVDKNLYNETATIKLAIASDTEFKSTIYDTLNTMEYIPREAATKCKLVDAHPNPSGQSVKKPKFVARPIVKYRIQQPINDENKLVAKTNKLQPTKIIKARMMPLPKIKVMVEASANVPDYGEPVEKSSRVFLRTIGTKQRAQEIVTKFGDPQCTYARIRCIGTGEFTPELLDTVFTPCKFYWNNIFIKNSFDKSVSGMIVSTQMSESIILRYIAQECVRVVVYKGTIEIQLDIATFLDFKSTIYDIQTTMEYVPKEDAANHKIVAVQPGSPARLVQKPKPVVKPKVPPKLQQQKIKTNGLDNEMFAELLMQRVEEDCRRSEFVSSVLPELTKLGETVIRVDNILANTTVCGLNLMMGTYTITRDRVVGVVLPHKNSQDLMMSIRIVMESNNRDIEHILTKDKCKTAHKSTLLVQRTNFKELEKFLCKNYDKICKLDVSNMAKPKTISYSQTPMACIPSQLL